MRSYLNLALLRRLTLIVACVAGVSGPALAQGSAPSPRDLEALNYYISTNDTAATAAELRRLSMQFPGWKPPSDLSALRQSEPSVEIDQIYRQIASRDHAGARRSIADTSAKYPNWSPPQEMTRLLETSEAQAAFDKAASSGSVAEAIRIVGSNPALLRCDRVNNAWLLADMHKSQGNSRAALQTFRGVIASCTSYDDVAATLEKSSTVATPVQMAELFDLAGGRFAANATELSALRTRLLGGAPVTPPTAPGTTRTRVPAQTQAAPAPSSTREAAGTRETAGSAPTGGSGGAGRLGQVRAAAARGAWAQCIELSNRATSADVIYERGWCAYNLDRPLEALAAFKVAAAGGMGATVTRDARFGMALSYLKGSMTEEAARIAAATEFTHQQRLEVETIILDQRGVRAYKRKEYRRAIAFIDANEGLTGKVRRDLAILRAYAYLNLGQRAVARRLFTELNDQLVTPETTAGMRASQ